MTKREFNFMIRHMKPKDRAPSHWLRAMLTPEQQAVLDSPEFKAERNSKKRNMGHWQRRFKDQVWRILFPGQPLK